MWNTWIEEMNEADERTIEVYEVNQLIVNNTLCKQTMRRLWTSTDGQHQTNRINMAAR